MGMAAESDSLSNKISRAIDDPDTKGSLVLAAGSLVWKGLSLWEHADFLLSVKEENFAMMFQFFDSAGWLILLMIGGGWLYWAKLIKPKARGPQLNWPFVVSCVVVAFLFGTMFALRASGNVPNVITSWSSSTTQCAAILDTTRLQSFKSEYKLVLICGIESPTIDRLDSENIMLSSAFDIVPGGIQIVTSAVRHPDVWAQYQGKVFSTWFLAALMPMTISQDKITTTRDMLKLGGKLVNPIYWN